MKNSLFKVTERQWFGLLLSIVITSLWWCQMVFVIQTGNGKDKGNDGDNGGSLKISKYQWCGLAISIVIGGLGWFRTVNIVDK